MKHTDEFLQPNSSFIRLYEEYKKFGSLEIALDFDNTVYDFHGHGYSYELMKQLVRDLKSINCRITVWTANGNIPYDAINDDPACYKSPTRKIFGSVYIDDRAGMYQVYSELSLLVYLIKEQTEIGNKLSNYITYI